MKFISVHLCSTFNIFFWYWWLKSISVNIWEKNGTYVHPSGTQYNIYLCVCVYVCWNMFEYISVHILRNGESSLIKLILKCNLLILWHNFISELFFFSSSYFFLFRCICIISFLFYLFGPRILPVISGTLLLLFLIVFFVLLFDFLFVRLASKIFYFYFYSEKINRKRISWNIFTKYEFGIDSYLFTNTHTHKSYQLYPFLFFGHLIWPVFFSFV